jgi:hypothetical protein
MKELSLKDEKATLERKGGKISSGFGSRDSRRYAE